MAFCSGVSQRSPSTPGVFLPLFSVTRLTAQARAATECTNRELSRLTLRHAPRCTAWTSRRCRDRTRREQPAQSMPCQAVVVRPKDACSTVLLIINRASVYGLPQVLRPVTPLGSQHSFGSGQSLNPSRPHYRTACASSRSCTRYALPRTYAGATRSGVLTESVSGLPRSAGCTHKRGEGASVHRGIPHVRWMTVNISQS